MKTKYIVADVNHGIAHYPRFDARGELVEWTKKQDAPRLDRRAACKTAANLRRTLDKYGSLSTIEVRPTRYSLNSHRSA